MTLPQGGKRVVFADEVVPSSKDAYVDEVMMRKPGRPYGSGYNDADAIHQVLALMHSEGASRRSAIIRVCGHDQLRRLELKLTAQGVVGTRKVRKMSLHSWTHGRRIDVGGYGKTVVFGQRHPEDAVPPPGGKGSDRTDFLLGLAMSMAAAGSGLIYVDGNGDPSMPARIEAMASSLGRGEEVRAVDFSAPDSHDESFGSFAEAQIREAARDRRFLIVSMPGRRSQAKSAEHLVGVLLKGMAQDHIGEPVAGRWDELVAMRGPDRPVLPIILDGVGAGLVSDMELFAAQARSFGFCLVIADDGPDDSSRQDREAA